MLKTLMNNSPNEINGSATESQDQHSPKSATSPTDTNNNNNNNKVKKRVRTGCLNCRRKHKKCDETKPICITCNQKNEICQWPTVKISNTDIKKNLMTLGTNGVPLAVSTSVNGLKDIVDRRNSYPLNAIVPPLSSNNYTTNSSNNVNRPSLIPTVQTNQMGLAQLRPLQNDPQFLTYPKNGQVGSSNIQPPPPPQTILHPEPLIPHVQQQSSPAASVVPTRSIYGTQPSMEFLNYTLNLDSYRRASTSSPPLSSNMNNPLNLLKFQIQPGTENKTTFLQLQRTLYNVMNQSFSENNYSLKNNSKLTNEGKHILLNHYINKIAPKLSLLNTKIFNSHVLNVASRSPALMYSIYALSLQDFSQGSSIHPFNETPLSLFEISLYHLQQQNFQNLRVLSPSFLILTVLIMNMTNDRKIWKDTLQKLIKFMSRNRIEPNINEVNDSIFWLVVLMDINITKINKENDKPLIQFDLSREDFKETNISNIEETIPKILTLLNSTINILNINNDDIQDFNKNWLNLWMKTIQLYELLISSNNNSVVFQYETSPFPCMIVTDPHTSFIHQNLYAVIILLLQNKPRNYKIENTEIKAITWYAKRACGISIANNGHNNWFNGEFCLYVSGKLLTHIDEHKLILQCLNDLDCRSLLGVIYHSNSINNYWNGGGI